MPPVKVSGELPAGTRLRVLTTGRIGSLVRISPNRERVRLSFDGRRRGRIEKTYPVRWLLVERGQRLWAARPE